MLWDIALEQELRHCNCLPGTNVTRTKTLFFFQINIQITTGPRCNYPEGSYRDAPNPNTGVCECRVRNETHIFPYYLFLKKYPPPLFFQPGWAGDSCEVSSAPVSVRCNYPVGSVRDWPDPATGRCLCRVRTTGENLLPQITLFQARGQRKGVKYSQKSQCLPFFYRFFSSFLCRNYHSTLPSLPIKYVLCTPLHVKYKKGLYSLPTVRLLRPRLRPPRPRLHPLRGLRVLLGRDAGGGRGRLLPGLRRLLLHGDSEGGRAANALQGVRAVQDHGGMIVWLLRKRTIIWGKHKFFSFFKISKLSSSTWWAKKCCLHKN